MVLGDDDTLGGAVRDADVLMARLGVRPGQLAGGAYADRLARAGEAR